MMRETWQRTNPVTTQAQNQYYKVAPPNTHLIYELLEHIKWAGKARHADPKIQNLQHTRQQYDIREQL